MKSSSIYEADEDVDYEYWSSNHNAHATFSISNSLHDIFKDGCFNGLDQMLHMLMPLYELENLNPLKQSSDKTIMFHKLLKGQALPYFEHQLRRRLEAEDSKLPENNS
jgi:hypothetical protein